MSVGRPWMKFYPRDWRGDQALRACSVAARGLWAEMLAIMHEAEPYGHLLLAGKPIDISTLASMAAVPLDLARDLNEELRRNGVYSVNKRGVVFSRRMVADHKRSKTGKKGARIRWKQDTEKPAQSQDRNAQRPEARVHSEESLTGFSHSERAPAPEPVVEKPKKRTRYPKVAAALMTAVSPATADAVIEHRLRIKSPLTVRGAELLAAKYRESPEVCGLTPDEAADYQISRSWRGFDPEWVLNAQERRHARAPPTNGMAATPAADEWDRVLDQKIAEGQERKRG